MAFWDASAILPLCLHQPATGSLRRLVHRHGRLVVWWGMPVEIRSGLARLVRERLMAEEGHLHALTRLSILRRGWAEVQPTERVRHLAEAIPEQYHLRAADALQLAAALIWCDERPQKRPFVCFDRRLAAAAARAGFDLISAAGSV